MGSRPAQIDSLGFLPVILRSSKRGVDKLVSLLDESFPTQ